MKVAYCAESPPARVSDFVKRILNRLRAVRWITGSAAVALFVGAVSGTPSADESAPVVTNSASVSLATNRSSPSAAGTNSPATVPGAGGYREIGFDQLSAYPVRVVFETVDPATLAYAPKIRGDIPHAIQALDGRRVQVKGFMLPLQQADGLVTEFLLLKDQSMCCRGMSPKVNEWIQVRMTGKGVRSQMDEPLILFGTLRVGEFQQSPQVAGVYRLDAEKLVKAPPPP